MTYLLMVAGHAAIEFEGTGAAGACEHIAAAVAGTYHVATACALMIGV